MKTIPLKRIFLTLSCLAAAAPLHAAHPFICCDYNGDKVAIVSEDGKIEWEYATKHPQDCWLLPNGNYLIAYVGGAQELTRAKEIVWE